MPASVKQPEERIPMKIVALFVAFNGEKKECALCKRPHGRSFVCRTDDGKLEFYGSGCIQKTGIDKMQLASVLSKATVQTARMSYDLLKGAEQ